MPSFNDKSNTGARPPKPGGFGQTDPMEMSPGFGGFGGKKEPGVGGMGMGGPFSPGPGMAATPGFAQRRANAQSLYGPGGGGWANFGLTGGQGPGQGQMGQKPGVPKEPQWGGGMAGGQGQVSRPMEPPPMRLPPEVSPPFGGQFGARQPGMGQQPPQQPQFNPEMLQSLLAQPGFLRMLMQYVGQNRPQMGAQGPRPQAQPGILPPNTGPQGPIY